MRDDPFFEDTPIKTLDMAGEPFEFPVLYYDFRMIGTTFFAKTKKLKKLLPHANFKPIEILPGTSMLMITERVKSPLSSFCCSARAKRRLDPMRHIHQQQLGCTAIARLRNRVEIHSYYQNFGRTKDPGISKH